MPKTTGPSPNPRGFEGFAPQALDFFAELDAHQSRDWFLANKARYEETIRDPPGRLVTSLSLAFAAQDIPLTGDPGTSLFRINRDVRFSKDKRPYKTNAGAVLTRDGTKQSPGLLYFHLARDASFAAAGFYALEPPALEVFRRRILSARTDWEAVETALAADGLALSRDDAAVRLPRGYTPDDVGALGDVIRLKSFIVRMPLSPAEISSAGLVDTIVSFAARAQPLLKFGWAALRPGGVERR